MEKGNLDKQRQQELLKILQFIQGGGDFDTASAMFAKAFDKVSVDEIAEVERQLIAQGLNPAEIQRLCNVHADMFKGNIEEQKQNEQAQYEVPGHPVATIKLENQVIKSLVDDYLLPNLEAWLADNDEETLANIQMALKDLLTIGKHYARKETSLFPIMNKHGITAPPEVMWGVDDKIRKLILEANTLANQKDVDPDELAAKVREACHEVSEMIFKEEEIMLPMIENVATLEEWDNVKQEEKQIGYTLIQDPINWKPKYQQKTPTSGVDVKQLSSFFLNFKEGALNLEQLNAILDLLPFSLTFVDADDYVVYFGGGADIYPHSKNAIGNKVFQCHTAKSRPLIEKIFKDFHSGAKDMIEYWFTPRMMGRTLYLRYYAVRDDDGKYLGCLEVAQDITHIKELTGEKKTLD